MRKVKFLMVLTLMLISVYSFGQEPIIANPKGSKGIIANFNSLDISKGIFNDKTDNLSLGLMGYYAVANNIVPTVGLNFGYENLDGTKTKTLDYTIGVRKWVNWWFVGLWYQGITYDNYKSYENSSMIDLGYTFCLTNDIFIEPTLYYQKSFGDLKLNRVGFYVSLGMCF